MKKTITIAMVLVVLVLGGIGISKFVDDQVYIKAQETFQEVQSKNEGTLTELKRTKGEWLIVSTSNNGTYETYYVNVWSLFNK